ncbi:MAG: aminoglycoside phosphotransferase family protein [Chloroflexota bacterium]
MLEKPNIDDQLIVSCLKECHDLPIQTLTFLPLGADSNTAVYKAISKESAPYFVKLRRDHFLQASVLVPKFLHDQGIKQVIPPLPNRHGGLWSDLAPFKLILYPFVEGKNGFEIAPTAQQRIEFGKALKQFHTISIPTAFTEDVPNEIYTAVYRQETHNLLERFAKEEFQDPLSQQLAIFINRSRSEIQNLLEKTEFFAQELQAKQLPAILCHADMHGWNMLIDTKGQFFIVDWDTLVFAPKERDLMFIGCGLGGITPSAEEETALFYRGYGQTEHSPMAMSYFKYERVIQDIAAFCETILDSNEESPNRPWAFKTLKSIFSTTKTLTEI